MHGVVGVGDGADGGGAHRTKSGACVERQSAGGPASNSTAGIARQSASSVVADGCAIGIAQPVPVARCGSAASEYRNRRCRKRKSRGAGAAADQRSQRNHTARD